MFPTVEAAVMAITTTEDSTTMEDSTTITEDLTTTMEDSTTTMGDSATVRLQLKLYNQNSGNG